MRLRCPWPRCRYIAGSNVELGHHLADNPSIDEHTGADPVALLRPDEPSQAGRRIGPQQTPRPDDIVPGVLVLRYTVPAADGRVRVEMPCCPRDRVAGVPARGVLLPTARGEQVDYAVCPSCGWLWLISLDDEGGEDYTAWFSLVTKVAVAGLRRTFATAL